MRRFSFTAPLLVLVLSMAGCAKKVAVHPNSISNLDSYAYDLLLVEQDSLNEAKAAWLTGTIHGDTVKSVLNGVILQYNFAEEQWQQYHASGANADTLQKALDALVLGMGQISGILGKTAKPAMKVGSEVMPMRWIQSQPCSYDTSKMCELYAGGGL